MSESDAMSTADVRDFLGYTSVQGARTWCLRQGIEPLDWRARNGSLLWPADDVRQKRANLPGQGRRTDLKKPDEQQPE